MTTPEPESVDQTAVPATDETPTPTVRSIAVPADESYSEFIVKVEVDGQRQG